MESEQRERASETQMQRQVENRLQKRRPDPVSDENAETTCSAEARAGLCETKGGNNSTSVTTTRTTSIRRPAYRTICVTTGQLFRRTATGKPVRKLDPSRTVTLTFRVSLKIKKDTLPQTSLKKPSNLAWDTDLRPTKLPPPCVPPSPLGDEVHQGPFRSSWSL